MTFGMTTMGSRDNGLERFLLRLATGVVCIVVLVMLLRDT